MSYHLRGSFTESCDCTVICPCWVDDDPVGGHCTGLIAWQITAGQVEGIDVTGSQVVSVSTHSGNRRQATDTTSVLYVDQGVTDDQFRWLGEAFAGRLDGPLADLNGVSGTVLGVERATILVGPDPARPGQWRVLVHHGAPTAPVVESAVAPRVFEGETEPLRLRQTALSRELGVPADEPEVTAQQGLRLAVNVGALPAGTTTVEGRSGMRGRFAYDFDDLGADPEDAEAPEDALPPEDAEA